MSAIVPVMREQKLDFNERSDGSPAWLDRALKTIDATTLWRYPQRQVLEDELAQHYALNTASVLVTNGGDEAIDLVLRVAAKQQRTLLLPLPAFSQYRVTAARNDLTVVELSANRDLSVDQKALLNAIQPRQIIALTSPNNPTGEALPEQFVRQVIETARTKGSVVLFDAAYAEFCRTDYSAALSRDYDNVFVLRSFSKVYGMAALRVGYLLGNDSLIACVRDLTPPFNVSGISLQLARAALSDHAQNDQLTYVKTIQTNRETVRTRLIAMGVTVMASEGNFVLLRLNPLRARLVAAVLERNAIKVRCFSENELEGCIRITIPLDEGLLLRVLELALKPQLLCLDMDGVLIDTRASYDQCVAETVKHFSAQSIAFDTIQNKRNNGGFNDDWKLTQALLGDLGISLDLDKIITCFQSFYEGENGFNTREKILVSTACVPTLRRFRTAVVTGRPANEALSGTHRLPWSVDALVSRDDVSHLKPDPEGINKMQQTFKTRLTWMVGDSVDDMRAARGANAVAIGIGCHNENALRQAGADLVIDDINQLQELL